MAAPPKSPLEEALNNYSKNLRVLLSQAELSESDLERELMRTKTKKVSTKTINNIVNSRHPPQLDNLSAIAEHFGVPLWVMFLPELPKELLVPPFKDRLVGLMENYLACDGEGRMHTENIAATFAAKRKASQA